MYRSVSVIMMIMIKGLLYKLVLLLSFLSNMHVCCARAMLTLAGDTLLWTYTYGTCGEDQLSHCLYNKSTAGADASAGGDTKAT